MSRMSVFPKVGSLIFVVFCLLAQAMIAPQLSAQGTDVADEVRKAAELAISSSVSEALSESLDRSISLREVFAQSDTFYSQGAYGWLSEGDDGIDGADLGIDVSSYRALAGNTVKFTDQIFGGFALSATTIGIDIDGVSESIDFALYTLAGNASYILHKDKVSRSWASGLYQVTYLDYDSDFIDNSFSNNITPSLTFVRDFDRFSVETNGGFSYAINSEVSGSVPSLQTTAKLSSDIGNYVPQFIVSYTDDVTESGLGSLSWRPELNYIKDNMVFGAGFSSTIQLENDVIRSNEAFLNFRWRF